MPKFEPCDIACLIPTLMRPKGLERVLGSLWITASEVDCVVSCDPDDTEAQKIASDYGGQVVILGQKRGGCMTAWNEALRAAPEYKAYILGSDDQYYTDGWLEATFRGLEKINYSGLVAFNDGRKDASKFTATAFLVTRDFMIEYMGGVIAIPVYECDFTDLETDRIARKANKWVWAKDALVVHDWHGYKNDPLFDETYRLASEKRWRMKAIYEDREKKGFPITWEPIIK